MDRQEDRQTQRVIQGQIVKVIRWSPLMAFEGATPVEHGKMNSVHCEKSKQNRKNRNLWTDMKMDKVSSTLTYTTNNIT